MKETCSWQPGLRGSEGRPLLRQHRHKLDPAAGGTAGGAAGTGGGVEPCPAPWQ